MATVTSQLTRIHDVEGSLTLTSIGGGAGGGVNSEIVIQGAQSAGRKQSNATDHGFWLAVTSRDISGTGVHVGVWINHIHYTVLTKLAARLGSTTANYHEHNFPLAQYPALGGWVRMWINVGRTPDAQAGTFDKTGLTQVAVLASLPAVSGNAPNIIMDAADFTTGGLLLTGTAGVFQDFVTADEGNSTNKYGVVATNAGVIFCLARLTLGSASSLVFSDSGFVVVFPNQSTAATTFMGVTIDLQHASTNVEWLNGVLRSAGAVRGDLVVTGTSGTFAVTDSTLANLRVVTLTSACTLNGCLITGCGVITAPGASVLNSAVSGYEGATNSSSLVWNVNTDPDGKLDGTSFTKGVAATHAIEFGTSSPTSITLRDVTFTGFNGADGANDSTLHFADRGSDVTWTVNVIGGTTPSYKKARSGDTVVIVANPVTATVNCKTVAGANILGVRVLLHAADATGPFPFEASVTIANSGTTATVTHNGHGLVTNDKVLIKGASNWQNNGVFAITVTGTNTYAYTLPEAVSSPTGTITSTFVVLKGETDANGNITMSRVFPADQPVTGRARKTVQPDGPFYKTAVITGTVSASTGFSATALMLLDV
jgi:hypothetical protein